MYYNYTMIFHSDIKNEVMSEARKWMQPEIIVLNELGQFQITSDPSYYINARNCVCLYGMKVESELSMGVTGTGGQ